jgi:UvrD-like helicase C-terminal domain/AAA domain
MSVSAFMGPAGVGKTFHLMNATHDALLARPLEEGQRVLALSFMHGSRRRLDDRLRKVSGLRNRFACVTVDRFAWELCIRWRSLRRHEGQPDLQEQQYEATCDAAGFLMEKDEVRDWVARSYPYVVIDEAQDLRPERLRILRALETKVTMLAAADEFQCLIPALRPSPAMEWLNERCRPLTLSAQHRTEQAALISAAHAIRSGKSIVAGRNLTVMAAPGRPPFEFAAACVANAIAWNGGNDIAIITPSKAGGFVSTAIERVASGPVGKKKNGPFRIHWEQSDKDIAEHYASNLNLPADGELIATLESLNATGSHPAIGMCREMILRSYSLTGRRHFEHEFVRQQLTMSFSRCQRFVRTDANRIKAMTVHQAKNREFEGVVILWPYRVAGDAEQQRRLLYNGITRAKRWCAIVVQGHDLLKIPPFAAQP